MPRLLILCEYPTLLGGERSMLATLSAVAAAGFDVHVAAPILGPTAPVVGPLAEALHQRGIPHVPWPTHNTDGNRLPIHELRGKLEELIREVRPALVHANSLSAARIVGPVTAELGIRSIGHLRDIVKVSQQAVDDLNAHRRLLAVSRATRDFHVANGVDSANCVVVHNGVDLTEFQPRSPTGYLHRELALAPSARLVATIGQLGPRKGTDVALAAARRVIASVPDTHWLVIGERTSNKSESRFFEANLQGYASIPLLAERVHLLGTRNDIFRVLSECELLVHAARQEPLGRVLLEAAASGLAVVATSVGGTREIFPTEIDGAVLVPPDDEIALAEAVHALLRDDADRRSLAAAGRRRAEAAFDIRHASAHLIEQYHSVLN
jgi:glycosyltransferase involved in cell wall biosynthesis